MKTDTKILAGSYKSTAKQPDFLKDFSLIHVPRIIDNRAIKKLTQEMASRENIRVQQKEEVEKIYSFFRDPKLGTAIDYSFFNTIVKNKEYALEGKINNPENLKEEVTTLVNLWSKHKLLYFYHNNKIYIYGHITSQRLDQSIFIDSVSYDPGFELNAVIYPYDSSNPRIYEANPEDIVKDFSVINRFSELQKAQNPTILQLIKERNAYLHETNIVTLND